MKAAQEDSDVARGFASEQPRRIRQMQEANPDEDMEVLLKVDDTAAEAVKVGSDKLLVLEPVLTSSKVKEYMQQAMSTQPFIKIGDPKIF